MNNVNKGEMIMVTAEKLSASQDFQALLLLQKQDINCHPILILSEHLIWHLKVRKN
ncbi:MAG TPA: hypothetical protein PL110_21135 [Candidatus Eremiobacteraeota bacterium]|nr:MAG: hypothetical protein BWY64_03943 [bacterium ADurb.Bin363]HPZ10607.1 hypothetical protein [Candidatus Eremiobacteraeota bacterium]